MRYPALVLFAFVFSQLVASDRPNIVWITSEDNGPYLGCYGDEVARTPNIDLFAKTGIRYLNAFSNAAVCAPARQTLISGMYASSIGGQHMRSKAIFPDGVPFFPKYLRDAGYYTSNNSKTDYNGGPVDAKAAMNEAWNESSRRAHWRNREAGQPFFAVFNFTESHESNLFPGRWKKRELRTDLEAVKLPSYLPDEAELRRDMARYYDCLEKMDERVGKVLRELKEDGLVDDTIVFYFSDHGGSMPRGKSFIYDSGTRVPLVVRVPEKWKQWRPVEVGGSTNRLVSFVDFSATVLSLAGLPIPEYMQGQAFLGEVAASPREYVHTFRGRRGERYDIVRGVRSRDYLYIRNYNPHLPVMQFNGYSFEIPGYLAWQKAWREGRCTPSQGRWFEPKSSEELYRITDDPGNVTNLAEDPASRDILHQHRVENDRHIQEVRDSLFFPEGMRGRSFSAYQDDETYPIEKLIELGNAVSAKDPQQVALFREAMKSKNRCVRYWGATGCVVLGRDAEAASPELAAMLKDEEEINQLQAARALAGMGIYDKALPVIRRCIETPPSAEIELQAVLAIDECDLLEIDASLSESLRKAKGRYSKRVVARLLGN